MPDAEKPRDKYELAAQNLDAIEQEMKNIGYWQAEPISKDAYDFEEAFASDTMTFSQWLQFILVPNVRLLIGRKGNFPKSSDVGIVAVKEFDGDGKASKLVSLLNEFDAIFR